jgi:hypothetical protein
MESNPDLTPGTRKLYHWNMTKLVLPEFAHLTLREIGVARLKPDPSVRSRRTWRRARRRGGPGPS